MTQQGDVLLFQTADDGEITVEGGIVEMSGGLETAAYLSMFGGNEDDDGLRDNVFAWWGNLDETDPALRYRSETQNLLRSLPTTTGNLRKLEEAAKRDLAWFVEKKVASSVDAIASMPGLNRVRMIAAINAEGEEFRFEFIENWKASV